MSKGTQTRNEIETGAAEALLSIARPSGSSISGFGVVSAAVSTHKRDAGNSASLFLQADSFVQKLHNLIKDNTRTVSFKPTGGFEIHDLEYFNTLLAQYGLSKKCTKNPIGSLQRRLSQCNFRKKIGRNVYEWDQPHFAVDGKFLHKISSTNTSKRSLRPQNSSTPKKKRKSSEVLNSNAGAPNLNLSPMPIGVRENKATSGQVPQSNTAGDVQKMQNRCQPQIDPFIQQLYNLIKDDDGTIASFRHLTGGFEIHMWDKFSELLLKCGLSRTETKDPFNSFYTRLRMYDFKKVIGKNVYKWNQVYFTLDGELLAKIRKNKDAENSQKIGKISAGQDDDANVQIHGEGLQPSAYSAKRMKILERRLKQSEDRLKRRNQEMRHLELRLKEMEDTMKYNMDFAKAAQSIFSDRQLEVRLKQLEDAIKCNMESEKEAQPVPWDSLFDEFKMDSLKAVEDVDDLGDDFLDLVEVMLKQPMVT